MKNEILRQAEQTILLAILRKTPTAYGVSISEEIEARTGREIAMATIYATLEKLEDRGFVKSRQGEATPERGGRAKTYFDITGKGQKALSESLREIDALRIGTRFAGALA